MAETHVDLPGSRRPAKAGATRLRDLDPAAPVEVTVTLRGPDAPGADALGQAPMSRAAFAKAYSASAADAAEVSRVLGAFGLQVEETSLVKRSLRVRGTATQMEAVFHARLGLYRNAEQGEFRGRDDMISVPAELDGIVTGVFGLDERRVARRRGQMAAALTSAARPLTPLDIEQRYAFPAGGAEGQVIGIAEFGGGYFPRDVAAFCAKYGRPQPTITMVPVGLAPLTPAQIDALPPPQRQLELGESTEVMMDVEIIASLCPAATLLVYFAPFTQKGWVDLIGKIVAGEPSPCPTVSVSWGLAEDSPDWTPAARAAIDGALRSAAMQGVTVCIASGDDGSGDELTDGRAHVDFPSCTAGALSVGGTMVAQTDEVAWWQAPGRRTNTGGGATGGGVSIFFARPAWQDVKVTSLNAGSIDGRVMPDVAAIAGPPFYDLIFQGAVSPNGGTSAATPVWAALLARVSAHLPSGRPARFLTPILYGQGVGGGPVGAAVCRDVTSGNNTSSPQPGRGYAASAGFDAVSGWGVPNGAALLQAMSAA